MVQPLRLVGSFGECYAALSGVFGVLVLPVRSFTSVFCKVLNSMSCAHLVQIIPVLTRTCGPRGGCRWVHVLVARFMCSRNDVTIPFVFTCPFACMRFVGRSDPSMHCSCTFRFCLNSSACLIACSNDNLFVRSTILNVSALAAWKRTDRFRAGACPLRSFVCIAAFGIAVLHCVFVCGRPAAEIL